ncbi:hypothetical protein HDZ31DRAFT_64485 [Schizophyllum fasciatum]
MEDSLCKTVQGRAARFIPLLDETSNAYTSGHIGRSQAMVVLNEGQLVRSHLAAHIADLTNMLDGMDASIIACRKAVVPINKLPPELLSEVFACVVHEVASVADVRRGPWLLSHICHRWRALARGTPTLWTVVDIGDYALSRRNGPNLVKTYLKQSGDLPLACSLTATTGPFRAVSAVESLLDILLRHARRWRVAYFALDAICFDRLMPPPSPGFSMLESVEIHLTGQPSPASTPPPGNPLFSAAPRLRRALVSGAQHRAFSFPWARLEYYVGHVVTYDGRCVLPELLALQRFGPSVHASRPVRQPPNAYVLPSLIKLSVNHGTVVNAIATPVLSECALGSGPRLEQVSALIERSACSLRILRLIDNPISLASMRRLLQLCPDLRELTIGCTMRAGVGEIYALLDTLVAQETGPPLVPVLERLVFSPYQHSFDCASFVTAARSRSPAAGGRLLGVSLLLSQCELDNAGLYDALRADAPNLGLHDVGLTEDSATSDDIVNSWLDV